MTKSKVTSVTFNILFFLTFGKMIANAICGLYRAALIPEVGTST